MNEESDEEAEVNGLSKAKAKPKSELTYIYVRFGVLLILVLLAALSARPLSILLFLGPGPYDPSVKEFFNLITKLQMPVIALCAGGLGAYVRHTMTIALYVGQPEPADVRNILFTFRLQIVVGSIIGIFAYFLIQTRFVLQLLYTNLPEIPEITVYGVGIIGGLAGLLARELVGQVTTRFQRVANQEDEDNSKI